LPNNKKTRVH